MVVSSFHRYSLIRLPYEAEIEGEREYRQKQVGCAPFSVVEAIVVLVVVVVSTPSNVSSADVMRVMAELGIRESSSLG